MCSSDSHRNTAEGRRQIVNGGSPQETAEGRTHDAWVMEIGTAPVVSMCCFCYWDKKVAHVDVFSKPPGKRWDGHVPQGHSDFCAWRHDGHEFSSSLSSSAVFNHLWELQLLEAMAEGPRVGPGLRLLPAVRHGPKATEKQAGPRDLYQAAPATHRKGPPSFPTWTQVSLPSFLPLQPLGLAASSRTRALYAGPSPLPSPVSLLLLQLSAGGVGASGGAR